MESQSKCTTSPNPHVLYQHFNISDLTPCASSSWGAETAWWETSQSESNINAFDSWPERDYVEVTDVTNAAVFSDKLAISLWHHSRGRLR